MTRDDPGASNPTIADGVDEPPAPNQRKLDARKNLPEPPLV